MVLRLSAAGAARLPADPALPPPLEVQPERREALAGYALDGTGLALLLPVQAAAPRLVALDAAYPPPAPPRRGFAARLSVRRFALAPDPDTLVDATLEAGTLAGEGTAATPVRRLTLSLRTGDPAALARLALALHAAEPVALEAETLAAQGLRLAAGGAPPAQHAREPALEGTDSVGEGLRQVVLAGVRQMLGNEAAIRAGDVEGVHQMRVAVRQLRAGLRLFAPALGEDAHRPFDARLQALGRLLGEARDWDVFCTATLPEVAAADLDAASATAASDVAATATLPIMATATGPDVVAEEPDVAVAAGPNATGAAKPDATAAAEPDAAAADWDALVAAAAAERERAHAALLAHLDGPAPTQLGLELIAWAEGAAAGGPLAGAAPALLRTLARKVLRHGRHLARLPAEALHDRRKALKRLRYATDFLGALFPGAPMRRFRKRCRAVQAVLGDINDASMTATLVARLDAGGATQRLLAWNVARHDAALARLAHDWARLRAAEPFWA